MSSLGTAPTEWDFDVDLIVAGSGNGGLSAAIAAAQAGARVLVVEMGSVTGGSSAMSGGGIRIGTATSYEHYLEITHGMHDAAFSRVYFNSYIKYIAWLKEIGAAVTADPPPELSVWMGTKPGTASEPQCREYFDSLERVFQSFGGRFLMKSRARKILTDGNGAIIGLRAQSWRSSPLETDGRTVNIKAPKIVLSTGGFQNNKEMCTKYLGADADLIAAVGSPYNRGEGMVLAQELGASLSGSMGHIYGGYMSAYPARRPMESPEEWETKTDADKTELFDLLYFTTPPGFIAVNVDGKRFVDESEIRYRVIQAVAKQPRAMGIMLFDAAMYAEIADLQILQPGTWSTEREKFATREKLEGSKLIQADTIEELADKLAKIGPHQTYKANLLRTIAECARAADESRSDLEFNRPEMRKLQTPPFYAWPFTAGVVYTMGGLAINTSAQVLDQQRIPIPGLYASPPCAGGVFRDYYAGSIASAGVFGWIAGRHAAAGL